MTAIFVLVTNFWIRWQKTDIKPKGLPALQTKKGRRFVVKLLPFVHTAMWVLHTVFISECFQLVVPAMIFVETFALPQPIGNEIASVTNFRIRWQKTDKKQKGLPALQTKKSRRFVVKRLPCVHTAMWICTSVCTLVVNVVQGDNQRNEERNVPFVGFQFESVGDESYLPSYSAYDVAVAQYL